MPASVWAVQHWSQLGTGAAWPGSTSFLLGAMRAVCVGSLLQWVSAHIIRPLSG